MTNEIFIKNLKNKFSNLNGLIFQENYLIYNDEKIDLKNIHLETFFRQNTNLMKDLDILDSLTVFKIIFYHCYYNMEKEIFLNIDENIVIKALRVVNHKNSDGLINNYIYLIDEKDNTYISRCDYATEVFNFFENNLNNQNQLTVGMINEFLKQFKTQKKIVKYQNDLANDINDSYYEDMMLNIYEIQYYLLPYLKNELDMFLHLLEKIEIKDSKTKSEENILNKFKQLREKLENNEYQRVRDKKGYFNGFLIIGLVVTLGIILSLLLIKSK